MYARSCGAVETSTDEARNSSTTRRLRRTRSESVRITMPASTLREQAGTSVREPSSSTTQTRQTFTGVSVSRKQSVAHCLCHLFQQGAFLFVRTERLALC